MKELPSLVGEECVVGVLDADKHLIVFWYCCCWVLWFRFSLLGGSETLHLVTHVTMLSLLGFWEMFMDVLDIDQWPCAVVSAVDGFGPCCFCGGTCGSMQVSDGLLPTWEFINIVDGFWVTISGCFEVVSNLL